MLSSILCVTAVLTASGDLPVAEVKMHNGTPTLFINGTPHPGTSYMTYVPEAKNFEGIAGAGVHLFSFSATPTAATPYDNIAKPVWLGPDEYDYSALDARVRLVLEADPDAFFFPRLFLGTPAWWAEAHPAELVQYRDEDGTRQNLLVRGKPVASFASEQWRVDTREALARLIGHMENADYAGHIVGYQIASGMTEEWMQWLDIPGDHWAGYSPANAARFRAWLKTRYDSDAALQKAWKEKDVTLDSATVPSRELRARGELAWLRNPALARQAIDYTNYNAWLVTDTIRYFARAVKEAVHGERLVGTFYGYVVQLASAHVEQTAGHFALRDILECPDIDFLTSPTSYTFRNLKDGYPHTMSLLGSVKHHGKLWFDENDQRTWLAQNVPETFPGYTRTFEDSLLVQRRQFGWVMTQRIGMWWFDMGGGWYDDPRMLAEIGRMNAIAHANLDADASSVSEIALVVHPESAAHFRSVPDNPITWPSLNLQQLHLGRVGVPFDVVMASDLAGLKPYRLYIFANCLAPTAEERRIIAECVRREGVVALWVGPAGVHRDGRLAPEAMEELTGIPADLVVANAPWRVEPTPAAASWGWMNAEPFATGRGSELLPVADPARAVVLGTIQGTDYAGLVAREEDRAFSVLSSIPLLPTSLLRAVAEKAGVHFYADAPDIVWATRDLLAVHVDQGGPRTIRLPSARTAVDLWTGQIVAEDDDTFEVTVPGRGTALFRLY